MNKPEFEQAVETLRDHFDPNKIPTGKQMRSWFDRCQHIPSGQPLRDIVERVKDEYDRMPVNISKVVATYWEEWKQANPDKVVRREQGGNCEGCTDGYLFAEHQKPDEYGQEHTVGVVFRCPCLKAHETGIPVRNRAWMEKEGYMVTVGMPGMTELPRERPAEAQEYVATAMSSIGQERDIRHERSKLARDKREVAELYGDEAAVEEFGEPVSDCPF